MPSEECENLDIEQKGNRDTNTGSEFKQIYLLDNVFHFF